MDIVKKNLVSIICGVVALLALVAVFIWPLDGYITELKTQADQRAAVAGTIDGLQSKPRYVPVFDPANPDASTLTGFPSPKVIDLARKAQETVGKQSADMYDYVVKLNGEGKTLTVPGTLPLPGNTAALGFRRNFEAAMNALRTDVLVAGVPPTFDEIKRRADELTKAAEKDLIMVDGTATNLDQVNAKLQADIAKLPQRMQEEFATKYLIYVDPATVMRVPATIPPDGRIPDPVNIWWAQVEYWVTSDVVTAIAATNAHVGSKSVLTSPVKSLKALEIPANFYPALAGVGGGTGGGGGFGRRRGGGGEDNSAGGGEGGEAAAYAPPKEAVTKALPTDPISVPSGRLSNGVYDVVHFTMTVDIEADKVPLFLKMMATNRLMAVNRMEWVGVDSTLTQINGFHYGNNPVVTLSLECEALLMRDWTVQYMPPAIKVALGIPERLPANAAQARRE